jgi:hypothetical protein
MEGQPSLPHFRIEEQSDALSITLPIRKNWQHIMHMSIPAYFVLILFCVLIYALVAITVFGNRLEATPANTEPLTFGDWWGLFILSVMFVAGLIGLANLLWQLFGKEIVEVRPDAIRVSRQMPGFRRSREYAAEHIKNLRTFPSERGRFEWDIGVRVWNRVYGTMGFDYGAKKIRFASALDMAEANQLIAAIQQRFPQYRST